jgi:hypothetical protein
MSLQGHYAVIGQGDYLLQSKYNTSAAVAPRTRGLEPAVQIFYNTSNPHPRVKPDTPRVTRPAGTRKFYAV